MVWCVGTVTWWCGGLGQSQGGMVGWDSHRVVSWIGTVTGWSDGLGHSQGGMIGWDSRRVVW